MIEEIRFYLATLLIKLTLHIVPKESKESQRLIEAIHNWAEKEVYNEKGKCQDTQKIRD